MAYFGTVACFEQEVDGEGLARNSPLALGVAEELRVVY